MYVMGVIQSRRLGKSLGLDIIGADGVKRCNFNCVYCEVGNGKYTVERGIYADFDAAITELKEAYTEDIDVVTFSGNGEPTLNREIGRYIDAIHKFANVPVCVITNSTLLSDMDVEESLLKADIVMPSIDSCNQQSFLRVDRPRNIDLEQIKKSILDFSKKYKGKLFLEILFVKGFNDSDTDIYDLYQYVQEVMPTELHINTIDRTPAEDVELFSYEEKLAIYERFSSIGIPVKIY